MLRTRIFFQAGFCMSRERRIGKVRETALKKILKK